MLVSAAAETRSRASSVSVTGAATAKIYVSHLWQELHARTRSSCRFPELRRLAGRAERLSDGLEQERRDTFTLQGDLYHEDAGERVEGVSYTQPFSRIVDSNAELSGGNIMARWQRTQGDGNDIQVQAYFDRTHRLESNFGEVRNTFDVDFVQRRRLPARTPALVGPGRTDRPGQQTEVVSGLTFVPNRRTDYLLTAFLQDDIGLVDRQADAHRGNETAAHEFHWGGVWSRSPAPAFSGHRPNRNPCGRPLRMHYARHRMPKRTSISPATSARRPGIPFFARFNANPDFASNN